PTWGSSSCREPLAPEPIAKLGFGDAELERFVPADEDDGNRLLVRLEGGGIVLDVHVAQREGLVALDFLKDGLRDVTQVAARLRIDGDVDHDRCYRLTVRPPEVGLRVARHAGAARSRG